MDARITVSANGTNKVGDPHTFTVLVEKNDGTGWTPAENVAVTSTESGVGSITGGTCGAPNTGPTTAAGTCTIIVNSNAVGVSTVQASGTVTIGTVSIPVATNGYGAHDIQNTKTWVDARITISQSGTNPVGQAHTFTVTVEKNLGSGWVAANGVTITSTTNFGNITGGTCGPTGPTNASGQCTVTVNSNTAGTATVNASGTVAIGAINIAVATNGYGAHDISNQKTWVSQSVTTQVHNTSHTDITNTSVAAPATVHDQVTVTTSSGPGSGTVDFTLFRSNNCTGTVEGTWNDIALDGTGKAETPAVTLNPASTTSYSYLAHYDGNGPNFPAANAACEPFTLTASALLPCPAGLYLAGLTNTTPTGDLKVAYDQFPAPNDNSYGANSIGWGSHDRAFKHLLNSDHAGFLVLRPNGTTALSFDIDYITKTAVGNTPSGYASLGPFGGDGLVRTGTLTAADIQYDSSMARNLNRTGYFVGGVQTNATKTGTNSADLLVDSPPAFSTIDNATGQYILKTPNPWSGTYVNEEYDTVDTTGVLSNFYVKNVTGWNFHNTYFVTLKAGKLNALGFDRANWTFAQFSQRAQKCPGKWCVVPNDEQLHNSPAKVCPVSTAALSMRAKS